MPTKLVRRELRAFLPRETGNKFLEFNKFAEFNSKYVKVKVYPKFCIFSLRSVG